MPAIAEVVSPPRTAARRAGGRGVAGQAHLEMPTPDQVRDHFERAGAARQQWPAVLQRGSYPRTASGKVQKYVVRQHIKQMGGPYDRTGGRQSGVHHRRGARSGPQSRPKACPGRRRHHRRRHRGSPVEHPSIPPATPDDLAETAEQVKALNRRIVTAQVDVRASAGWPALSAMGSSSWADSHRRGQRRHRTSGDTLDQMDEAVGRTSSRSPSPACGSPSKPGCRRSWPVAGASIVLTSSVGGLKAYSRRTYVSAKHGVVGLMRTFAVELGPHSIRVNSVHPSTPIRPC